MMETVKDNHSESSSALASLRYSATRFPFSVRETVRLLRTGLRSEILIRSAASNCSNSFKRYSWLFFTQGLRSFIKIASSCDKRCVKTDVMNLRSNTPSKSVISTYESYIGYLESPSHVKLLCDNLTYNSLNILNNMTQVGFVLKNLKAASESENAAPNKRGNTPFPAINHLMSSSASAGLKTPSKHVSKRFTLKMARFYRNLSALCTRGFCDRAFPLLRSAKAM